MTILSYNFGLLYVTVSVSVFIGRVWKRLGGNDHSIPTTKNYYTKTTPLLIRVRGQLTAFI